MLRRALIVVICVLGVAACSGMRPHGVDTGDKTVPVYKGKF